MQSKGLSRVFSNTTVQKHKFFGAQPSSHNLVCFKSDAGKYEYILTVRNSYRTGIVWRASRESVCQHPVPACSPPQRIHSSRSFSLHLYQYPFTHSHLGFSSRTPVIMLNILLLLFFPSAIFRGSSCQNIPPTPSCEVLQRISEELRL